MVILTDQFSRCQNFAWFYIVSQFIQFHSKINRSIIQYFYPSKRVQKQYFWTKNTYSLTGGGNWRNWGGYSLPPFEEVFLQKTFGGWWGYHTVFETLPLAMLLQQDYLYLIDFRQFYLGKGAENQNGNLRWHLP